MGDRLGAVRRVSLAGVAVAFVRTTMTDVMLDLETMGTDMDSAIIQIGAYVFNPKESVTSKYAGASFFCNVTLQSSLMAGLTIDPGTLQWWKGQGERAKAALAEQPIHSLDDVLSKFALWLGGLAHDTDSGEIIVWSHGAAFDIPLLQHAYKLAGQETPWNYRNTRDTRTVFAMAKERGWLKTELAKDLAHRALYDANHQASEVQSALAWINEHNKL